MGGCQPYGQRSHCRHPLFPNLNLTEFGKICNNNSSDDNPTKSSKALINSNNKNISTNLHLRENSITPNDNKLYNCK